jgi:hyperosmotically inducible protein
MQKRLLVSAFGIVATVVTLSACNKAPEPQAAPKMSNDDLDRAVTTRINDDATLAAYKLDVDADADKNEVTLSGTVPSQGLRMKAVDAAKAAHAGVVVNDKIDVKPGNVDRAAYTEDMAREARERAAESKESVGDSLDDAWIHTKVRSKLLSEGEFPGGSINVDVKNNVVTLRGHVATRADRTKAEQLAKETEGVKSVANRLTIKAS